MACCEDCGRKDLLAESGYIPAGDLQITGPVGPAPSLAAQFKPIALPAAAVAFYFLFLYDGPLMKRGRRRR